jgi:hypothetical protein
VVAACNALVGAPPTILLPVDGSADGLGDESAEGSTDGWADGSADGLADGDVRQADSSVLADSADGSHEADAPASLDAGPGDAALCDADLQNDDNNCGWCGHSCLGVGCSNALCSAAQIVTPEVWLQGLYAMVVGTNEVFFTEWCGPALVWRQTFGVGNSALTSLAYVKGSCGSGIVKSGDTLYYGTVTPDAATLTSMTTDGGTPVLLATMAYGNIAPAAVDTSNVYYVMQTGPVGVYSVALDGGAPFATLYQGPVGGLVVLDADLYFTVPPAGEVMTVPKDGSGPPTLFYPASGDAGAIGPGIAGDAVNLYWSDATGVIFRGARDHSGVVPITPPVGAAQGLVVDDTTVYFGSAPLQPVYGVDKDGGNLRAYTAAMPKGVSVTALGFDAQYLYYSVGVQNPASIWRVPK